MNKICSRVHRALLMFQEIPTDIVNNTRKLNIIQKKFFIELQKDFGVNLFCMSDGMAFHSLGPEKVICFAECSSLLWESSN